MDSRRTGPVACPHCGGIIQPAASLCRHCRREVTPVTPVAETPQPVARTASVLDALGAFVVDRGLVSRKTFDGASQSVVGEASEVLAALAGAGHLTSVQVETLRDGFRLEQHSHLRRLLDDAVRRGLLKETHVQSAIEGFDAAVMSSTPGDYLCTIGVMTRAQVAAAEEATAAKVPLWKRAMRDPELRTPLLAGPGATLIAAPLGWVLYQALLSPYDLLLSTPVSWGPTVAVALLLRRRGTSMGRTAAWAAATFAFGAVIRISMGMSTSEAPTYVAPLRPHCTMSGYGRGECVFTNVGSSVVASCGEIVAVCRPRRGQPETRTSEPICSDRVLPGQTRRVYFSVAEFDRISARAVPHGGDWRDYCSFNWEPR